MSWFEKLIAPFESADGPPPQRLWPFFRWATRGSEPLLLAVALISVITGTIDVLSAFILGQIIDAALNAPGPSFWAEHMGMAMAAAAFFLLFRPIAFGIFSLLQSVSLGPNLLPMVYARLFRWTLSQHMQFFDEDFAGRLAQKQQQTATAITDVVMEMVHTVIFALASIIATLVLLFTIDARVVAVLALWMVGYVLLFRYFRPRIRHRSRARAEARSVVSGQVVDAVTNIKTVKLFAHAGFEDGEALKSMNVFRRASFDFGYVSAGFRISLNALAGLLPVGMVGLTLLFWSQGSASAGDIAAAGTVAIRLSQMANWVSFSLMTLFTNLGVAEDGMRTLTPSPKLLDAPNARGLQVTTGKISFENVRFRYGKGQGGVDGITLDIAPGEKLGLVGASGAGKSTIVSLLLRLYDVEEGAVRLEDQDVRDVTQESLRRQIALVTQETALFNRSARDNILYGRHDANDDALFAAARDAHAEEFIKDLRDGRGRIGYDAHLGERGVKLSGGQRQRIALARALLKNAPILVLDEATSALDSEIEAHIQDALTRAMVDKTVIAIAHRLSTLKAMDRIIVLDQGRIVEQGSHDILLAQGGLYARYWHRQSGGFIRTQAAE